MNDDLLEKEEIVVEVKNLIADIDAFKDKVDVYCDLMKQIFLSRSNKN